MTITSFLEGCFGTPVIDQTGLTQHFHIDFKWNERSGDDPDHDALKQALLDQLGLELVPSNMPVEMLWWKGEVVQTSRGAKAGSLPATRRQVDGRPPVFV